MDLTILKNQFLKSFYILKNNPKYVVFSVIFDLLFFAIYGVVSLAIFNVITDKSNILLQIASSNKDSVNQLIAEGKNLFQAMMLQQGFGQGLKSILLLFFALMIFIYLVYCVFQGLNWRIARNLTGSKFRVSEFMKSFFKINILWLALLYLGMFFERMIGILILLSGKKQDTGVIALIIAVIIAYFAFISYALPVKKGVIKRSFASGFKKFLIFVPVYVIVAIVFLIINYILLFAQQINYALMVVLGFLLFLPALSWVRVFICLIINKINKVKNA
ncbi:MAG: hypothetical protein Q7J54_06470 [Candidatus Woesearchaeota archaeon]|nr:hypothetical protein [Candidatus Woesearchaeota archaeon]